MEEKQLDLLMRKFLDGTANESERKQLDDWYRAQNERDVIWVTDGSNEEKRIKERMRKNLEAHMYAEKSNSIRFSDRMLGRAAAVFIGLSLMAGVYFFTKPNLTQSSAIMAAQQAKQNRYVLLPDSSTVLLHPGARIDYQFNGKTRELTLVGEAFFDIKHETRRPFIIHTGKIITTVLGTAFNIKAYPGQKVVVAVTRGKVSVIDETKKLLAVLTPDRSVEYNSVTQTASQQKVDAEKVTTWVKADVQFDDIVYKDLAEKLSQRYNVAIKFKYPDLEKRLVTGHFKGTESLDWVMKIIAQTTNTTYTIKDGTVTVDLATNN